MSGTSNPTPLPLAAALDREVQRGIQHPLISVIGGVVVTDLDRTVLINASGGAAIATLPSAVGLSGMRFEIQKIDSTTNTVTVTPVLGQTINGAASFVLQQQYDTIMIVSDGANWFGLAGTSANLIRTREEHGFGTNTTVPAAGTRQLAGPGNTLSGLRTIRTGLLTGGSIQVDMADAVRTYNFEIRRNGITVATVALPVATTGNQSTAFAVSIVSTDIITAFMVKTAGAGASTFGQIYGLVEITV